MENKKKSSLTKSNQFQELRVDGLKSYGSSWLLITHKKNQMDFIRSGWTISKKVGTSVLRNKFKRWSREYIRKKKVPSQCGIDLNLVLIPRKNINFKQISHSFFDLVLDKAWNRVEQTYKVNFS